MKCPICGLINPPDSSQCDCGYNFIKRTGGRRPSFGIRHRGIFFGALFIAVAIGVGSALVTSVVGGVMMLVLITFHITLLIGWIRWARSPFSPSEEPPAVEVSGTDARGQRFPAPRLRTRLLFLGLLACSLNIVIFWAFTIWMNLHHHTDLSWRGLYEKVEEACDFLLVLATFAGVFGKGQSRLPVLLTAMAGWAIRFQGAFMSLVFHRS